MSALLFSQESVDLGGFPEKYLERNSSIKSSQQSSYLPVEYLPKPVDADTSCNMPSLRFRDYICAGIGRADDDRVALTSSGYLRLELAQSLADEEEQVNQALLRRK